MYRRRKRRRRRRRRRGSRYESEEAVKNISLML